MSKSRAWLSGRIIAPLAAIALGIGLMALPAPAQAAFPGANGKIAYSDAAFQEPDFDDIYAVNPDGTGDINLTNASGVNKSPAWSPDGKKVAFEHFCWIATINADGTGHTNITGGCYDLTPAWSPDGTKIAFARLTTPGAAVNGLYVMSANGSSQTKVAGEGNYDPAWSPDGTKIAFTSGRDGNNEIYVMSPDGSNPVRLTVSAASDFAPNWSPDGTRIAFVSNRALIGTSDDEIYTMNADGTAQAALTDNSDCDRHPAWSPDGTKIAFERDDPGCSNSVPVSGLYTMNADGSGQTRVLPPGFALRDTNPDWQSLNPAPYPRPVGATPMHISLAPAFVPCTQGSANASHPAPLAGGSCNPPVPRSSSVAVGPRSLGFTRRRVLAQGECAPFDLTHCSPDLTIVVSVTDVRSGSPTGPDYDSSNPNGRDLTATATLPGETQGKALRITDLNNQSLGDPGGPYDKSATVVALSFPIPIDCTPTSDTSVGSSCDVATTANALVPGSAVAGKRAIWQIGQFQVLDQGQNGTPGDSDDRVFETQGLFVP